MKKRLFPAVGLVALMFISQAQAATSVVHDPKGDVGSSATYLNVAHARVVEQKGQGTLFFTMQLAGPIPEAPSEPILIWPFHVDTNPATSPGGLYNEYVVRVLWSNGTFVGQVIDRRGATPIITPVPFSIDGRTVKVFVPLQTLGNPSSFRWNAATRPGFPPVAYVDFAPDAQGPTDSSTLATWER